MPMGTPTGATFFTGIGDEWIGGPDPPVIPGIQWEYAGRGDWNAVEGNPPTAPTPAVPTPPPSDDATGGGGGTSVQGGSGSAPSGISSSGWDDYAQINEMLQSIFDAAPERYDPIIAQMQGIADEAPARYQDVRSIYDQDLGSVPSLDLRLPNSMGGGLVPLAPGKWSDMYSQQAGIRAGLLDSEYAQLMAALTGQGNMLNNMFATQLGAAGESADLWGTGQNINLGYAGLQNQLALQQMRNAANLEIARMQQAANDYWRQQQLNAADPGGSEWLPYVYAGAQGIDWAVENWDDIADIFSGWF